MPESPDEMNRPAPVAGHAALRLCALDVVHAVPGRVRWRYRCNGQVPARTLERRLQLLPGVVGVRVNARVRSLVVVYDTLTTDAQRLRAELLACETLESPAPRQADTLAEVKRTAALLLLGRWLPPSAQLPATMMAARTTLFMLALGEHLEASIARRSDELLRSLLRPDTGLVWVEREGAETRVAAGDLAVGNIVVVGAGATIPVDGTVLSGQAQVNEASMTGESRSVAKGRGARALSGTVVEEGRLRIYAEHVGRQTAVARIADYVESALSSKSQAQLGASRLADRLVPGVLGLAGITHLITADWQRTAAVLQADYACALKLATPVAFKSAMHRAGRSGILVKGADVLERLAQADTFIFDKTGTLTTGRLEVTDALTFDKDFKPDDLIFLAASVEEHYFHPLALAVVDAARMRQGRHFDHQEVHFIAAHGVASDIEGQRVVVGSRHFVEDDEGVAIGSRQRRRIEQLYRQGKTLLYIGFGGRLLGVIALQHQLRANAAGTLARLRSLGARRLVMLTGDHRERAAEVAHALRLDAFHAELMPEQKADIVQRMAATGARVAFVGDGINDAPALAGAHVGIAMQTAADVARLTADVALLEDDIALVADAKARADATLRLIGSNYRLTVGINSAILGAAALGRLSPVAASLLHNGATIGILLKALLGGTRSATAPRPRPDKDRT